jgi:hypothetical protein
MLTPDVEGAMKARLGLLGALALALLLGLLLAATPALAGSPFEGDPPGSQLGFQHDVNARAYITFAEEIPLPDGSMGEHLICLVVSSDPAVSGRFEAWITWGNDQEPNEAGNWLGGANATLTPNIGGGTWQGDIQAHISSGFCSGKPYKHIVFDSPRYGTGEFAPWMLVFGVQAAQGPAWILHGSIVPLPLGD